jgi:hypothetical protein
MIEVICGSTIVSKIEPDASAQIISGPESKIGIRMVSVKSQQKVK